MSAPLPARPGDRPAAAPRPRPGSALLAALVLLPLAGGPAWARYRLVWGDVHGHSRLSDGQGSVDDYFTYARDTAHLDFVILTDHDFGHGPPWQMATNDWRLIQRKADEYTVAGRFVAMAGYEWTSQPKYWSGWPTDTNGVASEHLFPGPPHYYNHKVVYFPGPVPYLFSSKTTAYGTPDLLAAAVRAQQGLIHNAHPDATSSGAEQFAYGPSAAAVIVNSEILPDTNRYRGKVYAPRMEQTLRAFLNGGGRTGFVGGSDTHDGLPAARTAVLVHELTRADLFEALRHRRNYAVNRDRIGLDFRINGLAMGEEVALEGDPRIEVTIQGTDVVDEVVLLRDGAPLYVFQPQKRDVHFTCRDRSFTGPSYYYVRVRQADRDAEGNPAYAWSSPIWVRRTPSAAAP